MTKVRILHAGGVGEHKQGDVVENAHDGLVEIATKGILNVADGELVAELVEDDDDGLDELRAQAKDLGIKATSNMKRETLESKIAEAQEAARLAEEVAEAARIAAEEAAKNAANQ